MYIFMQTYITTLAPFGFLLASPWASFRVPLALVASLWGALSAPIGHPVALGAAWGHLPDLDKNWMPDAQNS